MNVGQVFINVRNGHAYIARYTPAARGGLTWRVALNAVDLEAEASLAVEQQRGTNHNTSGHNASYPVGDYSCPLELSQKAIFVEVATRLQIMDVVKVLPFIPAVSVLFGEERVACVSWGAIATQGDAPIGLATIADRGERGDGRPSLPGIFVLPRCRRKGIGGALLRVVIEEAGRRGLLPLLYEALTPSGMALVLSTGYGPALLTIRNVNFGLELS